MIEILNLRMFECLRFDNAICDNAVFFQLNCIATLYTTRLAFNTKKEAVLTLLKTLPGKFTNVMDSEGFTEGTWHL